MLENLNLFGGLLQTACTLVTLALVIKVYLATKKARAALNIHGKEGEKPVILNFTGHPLTTFEADWGNLVEKVDVLCTVPIDKGQEAVEDYFVETIKSLPTAVLARVMAGDCQLVVAPPNMCTGEFLAVWHGIVGQFPKSIRSLKTEGKFVWLKPRDLQALRLEVRAKVRG